MTRKHLIAAAALWAAFSLPAGAQQPAGLYKASPPTLTDGQSTPFLFDSAGNLKTNSAGAALPAGTNTIGKVDQGVQGSSGSPWFVSDTSTPTTGTGGVTAVTVGTSSAQALAAASGGNRATMLALQNVSATASIACNLGSTAALNTAGSFQLAPGVMLTWNSTYVPQEAINCIASAASTPLTVMAK